MATVVQFGAGAIGRGFVGQLWCEAGYETIFVDVDPTLVAALNAHRSYPLHLVDNDNSKTVTVGPVRALDARKTDAVAAALADAAFACTAVGVSVFEKLAPVLAHGITARAAKHDLDTTAPLNILCCENAAQAGERLRAAITPLIPPDLSPYFQTHVACVDSSVGRMVPPPGQTHDPDPLRVAAESYRDLPFDKTAWLGPSPAVPDLQPKTNFAAYVARKLFIHNGGHAALAYGAPRRGLVHIWEAAEDPALVAHLHGFWDETARALTTVFGLDSYELRVHEHDLLRRFRNRALGDTVARVGRDPYRKLQPEDRLVGAALLCYQAGIEPVHVAKAIADALRFTVPEDAESERVQRTVQERGVGEAFQRITRIDPEHPLIALVVATYNKG